MIESLSASTGLLASDPMFWMPLALYVLVLFLLAGLVVLDGFDMGCGLLMPWIKPVARSRVLDALTAWRGANESWVLLLFAVFMSAFPIGWEPMLSEMFVPVMLLVTGSALRSLAFEFRARASMGQQEFWNMLFSFGAHCSVAGLGLWLAKYVNGPDQDMSDWAFVVLVVIAVAANAIVLATSWMLTWSNGVIRHFSARVGVATVRWVAAGMVAVSLVLALTNPAIYYRWTHVETLHIASVAWVLMLTGFVVLDRQLRGVATSPQAIIWWSPLVIAACLNLLMLGGLAYSYFPFLVLDNLTVWDAAASRESLRWVMAGVVVCAPILLVFNVLGYWRLFRFKPVRFD